MELVGTNVVNVGLIGGGPAGVSFLDNFLQSTVARQVRFNILVIEKANRCGPGLAFSPATDALVVNQRMSTMGLSHAQPDGFRIWLTLHEHRWRERFPAYDPWTNEHPPRALYGEYVADRFLQLQILALTLGHRIELLQDEAIACMDDGKVVRVQTRAGRTLCFDKMILATGNLPAHTHLHLLGLPGYFHSPWPIDRLQNLSQKNPDAPIYVFGNSLSAIDTANALGAFGHRGQISLVSRQGWTPKVLGAPLPSDYQLRYLTLPRLRQIQAQHEAATGRETVPLVEIMDLLKREVEECVGMSAHEFPWGALLLPPTNVCAALESDLRLANGPIRWQALLRATLPLVDAIWTMLSPEDQQTFEKFRSTWNRYRHGMARPTAERFLRLLQSGQAEVLGGLANVRRSDDGEAVVLSFTSKTCLRTDRHAILESHETADGPKHSIRADWVVNATGQGTHLSMLAQAGLAGPLLTSMLANDLITPHPAGGVRVDDCWRPLNRHGEPNRRILVLGHLTMGTLFYVSGMDKIAALAHDVTTVLGEMLGAEELDTKRVYRHEFAC